jgi:hypothetical protein
MFIHCLGHFNPCPHHVVLNLKVIFYCIYSLYVYWLQFCKRQLFLLFLFFLIEVSIYLSMDSWIFKNYSEIMVKSVAYSQPLTFKWPVQYTSCLSVHQRWVRKIRWVTFEQIQFSKSLKKSSKDQLVKVETNFPK